MGIIKTGLPFPDKGRLDALHTYTTIKDIVKTLNDWPNNLVLPKTSGMGIKVEIEAPTFPFRDMLGEIVDRGLGAASSPTWTLYAGTDYSYAFPSGGIQPREVWHIHHVPHDYVPGSDLFIHTHWSQNVVDSGGAAGVPGNVKWYFDVRYAKGYDRGNFGTVKTLSVVQQGSTTQYGHLIAEVQLSASSPSASQLDSDDIEPDGLIKVRTYRDNTDVADTLNQVPFLHYVDIHYQSTGIGTKAKNHPFYT